MPDGTDRASRHVALLLAKHGDELARHIRRIVRDDDAAQDILQDTMIRAYGALDRLAAGSNARAWLYRIATNAAFNHLRRAAPRTVGARAARRGARGRGSVGGPPRRRHGHAPRGAVVPGRGPAGAAAARPHAAPRRRAGLRGDRAPPRRHRRHRARQRLSGHAQAAPESGGAMIVEQAAAERRAVERIVLGAFGTLTGRRSEPLRYAMMDDTPVGVLGLAAGERGLRHLNFTRDEDEFLERLLAEHGDVPAPPLGRARRRAPRARALLRRAPARLRAGRRPEHPAPLSAARPRRHRAGSRLATWPPTPTWPAGPARPRASRAAGNALHNNPVAIVVPCHRVLRSDGSLGGYGGGPAHQGVAARARGGASGIYLVLQRYLLTS